MLKILLVKVLVRRNFNVAGSPMSFNNEMLKSIEQFIKTKVLIF